MKNNINFDFDKAVDFADADKFFLKRRSNTLFLSDYQIEVLNHFGINYNNFSNMKDLLYSILDLLDNDYNEELDNVCRQIDECIYYSETKK